MKTGNGGRDVSASGVRMPTPSETEKTGVRRVVWTLPANIDPRTREESQRNKSEAARFGALSRVRGGTSATPAALSAARRAPAHAAEARGYSGPDPDESTYGPARLEGETDEERSRRIRRSEAAPESRTGGAVAVVQASVKGKMAMLIQGQLSVEDMDDDELARMQFKNRDGNFGGRPNKFLPRPVIEAMRRELMNRGDSKYRAGLLAAIQAQLDIAGDKFARAPDRLKASQLIIERVMGRVPDKVEMSADIKRYEVLMGGISRVRPAERITPTPENSDITDAEIVEG